MMEKTFRWIMVAVMAASLSTLAGGCAKKKVETGETMAPPVEKAGTMEAPEAEEGGRAGIMEEGMAAQPESLAASSPSGRQSRHVILEGRTTAPMVPIYFDFDRSNIREDQQGRIEKNADFLKTNPDVRVRIEGNCDERGTDEYNMALGERRAQSAKKYLVNLGIRGSRMQTISYGEKRPLLYGHDELSWAQNRRDDFVIVD